MENFEAQRYRKNLAEELKSSEKNARLEILNRAKQTPDYTSAKHVHSNESLEQAKFPHESTKTIGELAEQIKTANKNNGIEQSTEELQIEAQMQWDYLESLNGLSIENTNEILKKVVDIYKEDQDLKFKDTWGIRNLTSFLNAGLLGEVIQEAVPRDVLRSKQSESNNLFSYRAEIKKAKNARDGYVSGEGMGYDPNTKTEEHPFKSRNEPGMRGNVYYPEGFIDFMESIIVTGEGIKDIAWKNSATYNRNRGTESRNKSVAWYFKERLFPNIPLSGEARKILKEIGLDISNYLELVEVGKDKEAATKLIGVWKALRIVILRDIIEGSSPSRNDLSTKTFHKAFPMCLGLIFSTKTKVLLKPHEDYPTQGVVMNLRAHPKDVLGIFMNEEFTFEELGMGRKIVNAKEKNKELQEQVHNLAFYKGLSTEDQYKFKDFSIYRYLLQQALENELPIYNLKGDLLWPQKLSHEEIVRGMNKNSEITEVQK